MTIKKLKQNKTKQKQKQKKKQKKQKQKHTKKQKQNKTKQRSTQHLPCRKCCYFMCHRFKIRHLIYPWERWVQLQDIVCGLMATSGYVDNIYNVVYQVRPICN